jgi:tetratricopeptide (TPR) repeat protein
LQLNIETGEPTSTLPELLQRAAAAQRTGNFAQAEWLCKEILLAQPDHRDALHLLGVIAHRQGRNQEALAHIERALRLGQVTAELHANCGTVLCALSRHADALASFDRALEAGPPTAELHGNRGLALYELGRFADALTAYRAALALQPNLAQAHSGMAAALCELGRPREAVDYEASGLSLRTDRNSRINQLIAAERYAEAVALVDEAMSAAGPRRDVGGPRRESARRTIQRVVVDCGHHLMHPAEASDLAEACALPVRLIDLSRVSPADCGAQADTLVIYAHGIWQAASAPLRALKRAVPGCTVAVWHFANHTSYLANAALAASADVVFPAHVTPIDYLVRWARSPPEPVVPLALFQWPTAMLARLYRECRGEVRSDALSGHFSLYAVAARRNRLIAEAIEAWPDADLSLRRGWRYHAASPLDRFLRWRCFKCSVSLPVCGDLSMRFFDALAAGQVPIVPRDIIDFDRIISPADQSTLPVIRLEDYSLEALRAAHHAAITEFNRGGEAAAEARHCYVLQRHMLAHRIRDIVTYVA